MKSQSIVCVIVATSMLAGVGAFAQASNYESQQDLDRNAQAQRNAQSGRRGEPARAPKRLPDQGRANQEQRHDERGAGPERQFHRGDRLPPQYHHRNYVVKDWRGHRLSAPPRGYHWVQTGNDYLLVAIATGVILQIILNN